MIRVIDNNKEYTALAIFTALSPLAVGGLVGLLITQGLKLESAVDRAALVVLGSGLLALAFSFLHLGRPWRAPLALGRLVTSWLSREILLFGLFLLTLGCYAILPLLQPGYAAWYLVGILSAIMGLLGTVATGKTYHLHSHPSWDQWLAVASFPLGALSAGSLFGFFIAHQFAEGSVIASYAWVLAAFFLVCALVVTWLRSMRQHTGTMEGKLSRQLATSSYLWLFIARVVAIGTALALIGIGGGVQFFAWIPALLGEFADRFLFFITAVPVTLRGRYLQVLEK